MTTALGDRRAVFRVRRADAVAPAPPPPPKMPVPERTLFLWNASMSLFHLTLAVVVLGVGKVDLTVRVYKTTVDFVDHELSSGVGFELIPYYKRSGALPLTVLVAAFFLLSSSFHFGNAVLWNRFYLDELRACRSPTRYTEYFLSAPLMMVVVAYSLGIRDRASLLMIAVLIAITMPFGYWTELLGRPRSLDEWTAPLAYRLFPFALGHVPQIAAWFVVAWQFYDGTFESEDVTPWWVHLILWAELLLFFSFGAACALSQVAAPRFFYRGELLFQTLSLVSKGLLGIVLLANVLMYSSFDEQFQ